MLRILLTSVFLLRLAWIDAAFAQPAELMIAARGGDLDRVEELLASGADPDPEGIATPLYFSAQAGHVEVAQRLLEYGADPNALSNWGTPLHIAARRGNIRIVEILLEHDADPNVAGGENNRAPLHEAADTNQVEIARLLIQNGADVNFRATGRVSCISSDLICAPFPASWNGSGTSLE